MIHMYAASVKMDDVSQNFAKDMVDVFSVELSGKEALCKMMD